MFQRKNQSVLAPHYAAMMAQNDSGSEEDEIFKLARKDHELSEDDSDEGDHPVIVQPSTRSDVKPGTNVQSISSNGPTVEFDESAKVAEEDMSKRKLKSLSSKRGLLKTRPTAEKTIFDESGNPTTFYQAGVDAERGAREERADYVLGEQERMKDATKFDREVAREIRKEKKRKRKDREKEVRRGAEGGDEDDDGPGIAMLGSPDALSDDAGGRSSDEESMPEPSKKGRKSKVHGHGTRDVDDEEALALRLLNGS